VPQHARRAIAGVHLDGICPEHGDERMVRGDREFDTVGSVPLNDGSINHKRHQKWKYTYKCRPGLVRLLELVCGHEEDLLDLGPECACSIVLEEVDLACWAADRVCVGVGWGKGYVR